MCQVTLRGLAYTLLLVSILVTAGCGSTPQRYVERGEKLFSEGKYEEAALNFRKVLQQEPQSGEALYGLGRTLLRQDQLVEGYKTLDRAAQLLPDRRDVKVAVADVALGLYHLDRSQKRFYDQVCRISRELLAKDPKSIDGWRLKGYIDLADRRPKDAIAAFRTGAPDLRNSIVTLGLSQALIQDNRFAEAEPILLSLLDADSKYLPAYDMLYYEYLRMNRIGDAGKILERKVSNSPKASHVVLQLAAHHARSNDKKTMEHVLEHLRAAPQSFPHARLEVGDFYASLRMWKEALGEYEAGLREAPTDRVQHYKRIAGLQRTQGKHEEARRALEAALKEAPKDLEARSLRAELLLDSEVAADKALALTDLTSLVREKREDAVLHANLGRAQLRHGLLEEAKRSFRQAIYLRRNYTLPRFGLAEIALRQGDAEGAQRYADEILAMDKRNPQARLLRVAAFRRAGRSSEARGELIRLQTDFPNWREVQLEFGMLALAQKRYTEAEQIFRRLDQQSDNDRRASFGLADVFLAQDRFEAALAMAKSAVSRDPNSWAMRNLLATVALRAKKFDEAREQYREMLRISPESLETRLLMGEVYRLQGDMGNAIRTFEEASNFAPKDITALMMLALAEQLGGRMGDAKKHYEKALEIGPGNHIAMNNLAYLLLETGGDLKEAERLARGAIQAARNQPNYSDTLGLVYLKKGMMDSALQVYANLVKQYPENAAYRFHYAMVFFAKGDRGKAREELKTALGKSPDSSLTLKINELFSRIG